MSQLHKTPSGLSVGAGGVRLRSVNGQGARSHTPLVRRAAAQAAATRRSTERCTSQKARDAEIRESIRGREHVEMEVRTSATLTLTVIFTGVRIVALTHRIAPRTAQGDVV